MLKNAFEGEPWFGRNIKTILGEINAELAMQKPGDHSILEILYHMITWREFVISRLQAGNDKTVSYFEQNDWRQLDHSDKSLWEKGIQLFGNTQQLLFVLVSELNDENLSSMVADREYNYRAMLHGVIQHDIYHIGQIAILKKMLSARS